MYVLTSQKVQFQNISKEDIVVVVYKQHEEYIRRYIIIMNVWEIMQCPEYTVCTDAIKVFTCPLDCLLNIIVVI